MRRRRADAARTSARCARSVAFAPAKNRRVRANGVFPSQSVVCSERRERREGAARRRVRDPRRLVFASRTTRREAREKSLVSLRSRIRVYAHPSYTKRADKLAPNRNQSSPRRKSPRSTPKLSLVSRRESREKKMAGRRRRALRHPAASFNRASSRREPSPKELEKKLVYFSFTESRSKLDQVSFHCLS